MGLGVFWCALSAAATSACQRAALSSLQRDPLQTVVAQLHFSYNLREPVITKTCFTGTKMFVLPQGLELHILFHAEIRLAVCGAPSGKKLDAFKARLVESVCFLPLWPGDIWESR